MAHHRHKRDTNARRLLGTRLPRPTVANVAGPLATVATAGVVSLGVLGADVTPSPVTAGPVVGDPTAVAAVDVVGPVNRTPSLSRGAIDLRGTAVDGTKARGKKPARPSTPTKLEAILAPAATRAAIANATRHRYTTDALNLWTEPGKKAELTGEVAPGEKVLVTGRALYGRVEIVWEKETRWVTAGYLSDDEPFALGGSCTNGSSVPSGVSPNIKKVHAAVCAAFPELTSYGTFRSDGEHSQGIAIDIMVSGSRGQQVADFVRENYAALGVSYVIYAQRIWSVERAGEGWRGMSDRGSTTANHYDHVHVTTY